MALTLYGGQAGVGSAVAGGSGRRLADGRLQLHDLARLACFGLQHRHATRYRAGCILTNEALLDSYNAQRRPGGRFPVRFTDRAFSVATSTNSLARTIRTPRETLEILPW